MNAETLYPIVSRWYNTGSLLESDKPEVIAAYNEITGMNFTGTCKKCQWSDVQHALRYHLIKVLNFPAMSSPTKYIIKKSLAYLAIHGLAFVYINKDAGVESASAKHLTDEKAEALLAENPDYAEVIVENPEYVEGAEPSTAPKAPKKTTAPATGDATKLSPQQKSAATKAKKAQADAEAKAKADAEEATRLAAEKAAADNAGSESTGTNE